MERNIYSGGYWAEWIIEGVSIYFDQETAHLVSYEGIPEDAYEILRMARGLVPLLNRLTKAKFAGSGMVVSPNEIAQSVTAEYLSIAYEIMYRAMWEIQENEKEYAIQAKAEKEAYREQRRNRAGYIYLVKSASGLHKIGLTGNPQSRIGSLNQAHGGQLEVVALFKVERVESVEKGLHSRFADKLVGAEWFNLDSQDVDYIKSLAQQDGGYESE